MFDSLKELFFKVIKSRLTVLTVVMVFLAVVLVQRLFTLQIVEEKVIWKVLPERLKKNVRSMAAGETFMTGMGICLHPMSFHIRLLWKITVPTIIQSRRIVC